MRYRPTYSCQRVKAAYGHPVGKRVTAEGENRFPKIVLGMISLSKNATVRATEPIKSAFLESAVRGVRRESAANVEKAVAGSPMREGVKNRCAQT